MAVRIPQPAPPTTGYRLLWAGGSRTLRAAYLGALLAGIALAFLYRVYAQSSDVSPDSLWGYGFAITGTALLLLVGGGYVLRKRRARHARRRLHTALAWHIAGGLIGVALIFMHAAGNFNPRSGTYALYGLIAVALSGFIGRFLDRICPRLAAAAVADVLTEGGEERLVALRHKLADAGKVRKHRHDAQRRMRKTSESWDLAYYDLDPEIETIPTLLHRDESRPGRIWRAIGPATIGLLRDPGRLADHFRQQSTVVNRAVNRERFFLAIGGAWRRLHALLCLVTLGLLIWHVTYAVALLMHAH
ncbi:MAG TPA: hypothetical protein VGS80_14160 [Ktedonobacterales bacterium]|nr:hypothetical protein [Ktedonobacterales bacterium]